VVPLLNQKVLWHVDPKMKGKTTRLRGVKQEPRKRRKL
jgi:hypothetical protein